MAYNSSYTGAQIDAAIGAVKSKESKWDTAATTASSAATAASNAAAAAQAAQNTANSKEAAGTAASAVSAHNTNASAHSDIRTAVTNAATAASNAASAAVTAQATANAAVKKSGDFMTGSLHATAFGIQRNDAYASLAINERFKGAEINTSDDTAEGCSLVVSTSVGVVFMSPTGIAYPLLHTGNFEMYTGLVMSSIEE